MDLWAKPHDGRDMIEELSDKQAREGIWKVISNRGPREGEIIDTIESTMTLKMVDRRYHVWEWREGEFLSYTASTYDYNSSRPCGAHLQNGQNFRTVWKKKFKKPN